MEKYSNSFCNFKKNGYNEDVKAVLDTSLKIIAQKIDDSKEILQELLLFVFILNELFSQNVAIENFEPDHYFLIENDEKKGNIITITDIDEEKTIWQGKFEKYFIVKYYTECIMDNLIRFQEEEIHQEVYIIFSTVLVIMFREEYQINKKSFNSFDVLTKSLFLFPSIFMKFTDSKNNNRIEELEKENRNIKLQFKELETANEQLNNSNLLLINTLENKTKDFDNVLNNNKTKKVIED